MTKRRQSGSDLSTPVWSKFSWDDWRCEPSLRSCSAAARGVWMDILCLAHSGTPYGHATINGKPATVRQIAGISGITLDEAESILQELEEAGVFSRRGHIDEGHEINDTIRALEDAGLMKADVPDGIIFCRRMVKDWLAYHRNREHGKLGGNPALKHGDNGGVNPPVGEGVKARSKKEEERVQASPGACAPETAPKAQTSFLPEPPPTPHQILWSEGLKILVELTGKSADKIRTGLGEFEQISGPEVVLEILRDCARHPPKGKVYAWIKRCCEQRPKAPRLVVNNTEPPDPNDKCGIQAWCRSKGFTPAETEGDRKQGKWLAGGWVIDNVALRVARAARFHFNAVVDWDVLMAWIGDGLHPNRQVIAAIEVAASREGYEPPSTLRFFDGIVRSRRAA